MSELRELVLSQFVNSRPTANVANSGYVGNRSALFGYNMNIEDGIFHARMNSSNTLGLSDREYSSVDDEGRPTGSGRHYDTIIFFSSPKRSWYDFLEEVFKDVKMEYNGDFKKSLGGLNSQSISHFLYHLAYMMTIKQDCTFSCTCPSFHWQHYKYSLATDGAASSQDPTHFNPFVRTGQLTDTGFWKNRNRIYSPSGCKHVVAIANILEDEVFLNKVLRDSIRKFY